MINFIFFSVQLIIFVAALFLFFLYAYRRNIERMGTMLVVILVQIISLSTGYLEWYRVLSAVLNISWAGN